MRESQRMDNKLTRSQNPETLTDPSQVVISTPDRPNFSLNGPEISRDLTQGFGTSIYGLGTLWTALRLVDHIRGGSKRD